MQTRNEKGEGVVGGGSGFSTAKVKRDAAAAGLKVTSSTLLAAAGHDGEQGESLLHYLAPAYLWSPLLLLSLLLACALEITTLCGWVMKKLPIIRGKHK